MNLEDKLRTGHVRRWHIVAVSREQTIADHMHRVGILTEEILNRLNRFDWDDSLTLNAMRLAFVHDRHEVVVGDIPTPSKEIIDRFDHFNTGSGAVEELAGETDPEYKELMDCCGPRGECPMAGYIVTLADKLEAMNYIGLFGCGGHARSVWLGMGNSVRKALADLLRHCPQDEECKEDLTSLIHECHEGAQWI